MQKSIKLSMIVRFGLLLLLSTNLAADDHIVNLEELHKTILTVSQSRQENLTKIEDFLSSQPVCKAFENAKVDSEKIQNAVSCLSDEELASLASRTEEIQEDFAAGALSNQQLTYIVIALLASLLTILLL